MIIRPIFHRDYGDYSGVFSTAAAPAQVPSIAPQVAPPAGAPGSRSKKCRKCQPRGSLTKEASKPGSTASCVSLQRSDVAGAVVVIIKDNQVLAKGYGYADVAAKAVDPAILRAGSVSKLYTWTAVMQLVEQGKIDLDTIIITSTSKSRRAETNR